MGKILVTAEDFRDICKLCYVEGEAHVMRQTLKRETTDFDVFFEQTIIRLTEINKV